MTEKEHLEVVNTSGLTDADWAEINKLQEAQKTGSLKQAMDELSKDPIRCVRVMGAFFPDMVREAIKDHMADIGVTAEDLHAAIRKLESPARDQ